MLSETGGLRNLESIRAIMFLIQVKKDYLYWKPCGMKNKIIWSISWACYKKRIMCSQEQVNS